MVPLMVLTYKEKIKILISFIYKFKDNKQNRTITPINVRKTKENWIQVKAWNTLSTTIHLPSLFEDWSPIFPISNKTTNKKIHQNLINAPELSILPLE